MKFVCKDCNYRFESEDNQTDKRCPYCESVRIIKEPSAEDLLGESDLNL